MSNHSHSPNPAKYVLFAAVWNTRARLVEKTNFAGLDGCWEFTGTLNDDGYGILGHHEHGKVLVHRLALHLSGRPVPSDMTVDHTCRNRVCVNPAHLEIVTQGENALRGNGYFALNARKTHCPQSHEYTPENTRIYTRPGATRPSRYCKTCASARAA